MIRDIGPVTKGLKENELIKLNYLEFSVNNKKIRYSDTNKLSQKRVQSLYKKEPTTLPWLERIKPDEVLVDIGANVGMYSIYAAAFSGARVYSFEPESQNYAELNKNIWLNDLHSRVTAFCLALSNEEKLSTLHLSQFGPAFAHHDFGENRWEADRRLGNFLYRKEDRLQQGAYSLTLDQLVRSGSIPSPDHIKIDVDGIERKVFEGALNTISDSKLKTILIEIDFDIPESVEIVSMMNNLGWSFSKDQVRLNQHEVIPYDDFEHRMHSRKGGANFIFFKDKSYHAFFTNFLSTYIPPNPPREGVQLTTVAYAKPEDFKNYKISKNTVSAPKMKQPSKTRPNLWHKFSIYFR